MYYDVREFNKEFITEIKNSLIRELINTYSSCFYKDIENDMISINKNNSPNTFYYIVKYKNSTTHEVKDNSGKQIIVRNFNVIIKLNKNSVFCLEKFAEKLQIDKEIFGKYIDVYDNIRFEYKEHLSVLNFEIMYCENFDILDKHYNVVDLNIVKARQDFLEVLRKETSSCFRDMCGIPIISKTANFDEIICQLRQYKIDKDKNSNFSKFENIINNTTTYLRLIFPAIIKSYNLGKLIDKLDMLIGKSCQTKTPFLEVLEKDKNSLNF